MTTIQDDVTNAASRVEAAVQQLGITYRELTGALDAARKAAWQSGGARAVEDINARAGQDRLASELAAALLNAGLSPVLEASRSANTMAPINDFGLRWARRAPHLVTTRQPEDRKAPIVGSKGIPAAGSAS